MQSRKKIIIAILILLLLGIPAWIFFRKSDCEVLHDRIVQAAKDNRIDSLEYRKLYQFVEKRKNNLKKCQPELQENANLDDRLSVLIKNRVNTSVRLDFGPEPDLPVTANLYLENSGSMDGYDSPNSADFRSTIRELMIEFPQKEVFIVNDSVYRTGISYERLKKGNNIFRVTKNIGNTKYTDFNRVFQSILEKTEENEVAILVSDLIISERHSKKNNIAIIRESGTTVKEIFKDFADTHSIIVVKYTAEFEGRYYPYNDNTGKEYMGKRPFYVTLIARTKTLEKQLKRLEFADWKKFGLYGGHFYAIRLDEPVVPTYTIVVSKNKVGEYHKDQEEVILKKKYFHSLTGVACEGGQLEIPIQVDFSSLYLADSLLTNERNYEVTDGFEVVEAKKLTDKLGFTHQILLRYKKENFTEEELLVTVRLKKTDKLPSWVKASHTDLDTKINPQDPHFANTTFGLESVLNGIAGAYETENNAYYSLTINLKK